jgi:hypothetical protein
MTSTISLSYLGLALWSTSLNQILEKIRVSTEFILSITVPRLGSSHDFEAMCLYRVVIEIMNGKKG